MLFQNCRLYLVRFFSWFSSPNSSHSRESETVECYFAKESTGEKRYSNDHVSCLYYTIYYYGHNNTALYVWLNRNDRNNDFQFEFSCLAFEMCSCFVVSFYLCNRVRARQTVTRVQKNWRHSLQYFEDVRLLRCGRYSSHFSLFVAIFDWVLLACLQSTMIDFMKLS